MEWWSNYTEYIVSNEVHILTIERNQAIAMGMGENFMLHFKDGRHIIFKFPNRNKYSVIYFPHQDIKLFGWKWEVYSFKEGLPIARAKTVEQLNEILAELFREAILEDIKDGD